MSKEFMTPAECKNNFDKDRMYFVVIFGANDDTDDDEVTHVAYKCVEIIFSDLPS